MAPSFTDILNITRSSLLARLLDLDIRSHNLANLNTTGFKSSRANFQEVLEAERRAGVQAASTQRLMGQGPLERTDNPFDLAIDGEGFFSVTLPDGRKAYTRDGRFQLDANRRLVSASGFPLAWEGSIPEGATGIHVNPDGSVMARQGEAWTAVGKISLARFRNPSGLENYGYNLLLETPISGVAENGVPGSPGYGEILAGALEQSNVNLAEEMTQIVALQRSFEMSVRAFQATDQMLGQAIHLRQG